MASINVKSEFNQLIKDLTLMDVSAMTDEMILAAEPVMMENLTKHASNHNYSGEMIRSIKSTGVKKNRTGKYLVVRPTGKDSKGVRNMEKMAYLEYGTIYQAATPVITPAVKDSEKSIESKMDEIFDKYTKKVSV